MRNHRTPAVAVVTVAAWPLEWAGWHFDQLGRLVSPERHRITPERLQGLLWRQDAEARTAARRQRLAAAESLAVDLGSRLRRLNVLAREPGASPVKCPDGIPQSI